MIDLTVQLIESLAFIVSNNQNKRCLIIIFLLLLLLSWFIHDVLLTAVNCSHTTWFIYKSNRSKVTLSLNTFYPITFIPHIQTHTHTTNLVRWSESSFIIIMKNKIKKKKKKKMFHLPSVHRHLVPMHDNFCHQCKQSAIKTY